MADVESENFPRMYVWIALSIFACVFIQIISYFISKLSKKQESEKPEEIAESEETKPVTSAAAKSDAKTSKPSKKRAWKGGKSEFTHPWLLKGLKGHTGAILDMDFSSNGKFLATSCEDRSVILWDIRDLTQKEHKSVRINIEFDHASFISWSPDSKAFIIHRAVENCIEVYKLEKKKDGMVSSASKVMTFEKVHTEDVIGFGISCNGKFMMSCSAKTDMVIWDLRGQQLARLDTYLMSTMRAKITPCGRFVVATGFAPDVKVMEVCFTRTGEFKSVNKAFELTGHTSGIYDVAFDADTSHIATVSKDGTWKLYHTKIEYEKGETPHVLMTGTYKQASQASLIALSPNAEVVVIATIGSLEFFDASNGTLYDTIEDVFSYPVTCLKFDSTGKYLFVCGDRVVRVFHNVAGYATSINTCQRLLKTNPTSATKERLQKTIDDARQFLKKFDKN